MKPGFILKRFFNKWKYLPLQETIVTFRTPKRNPKLRRTATDNVVCRDYIYTMDQLKGTMDLKRALKKIYKSKVKVPFDTFKRLSIVQRCNSAQQEKKSQVIFKFRQKI